jgi:hypothetical protein
MAGVGVGRAFRGVLNVLITVVVSQAGAGAGAAAGAGTEIGLALQGQMVRIASTNSSTADDDMKVTWNRR